MRRFGEIAARAVETAGALQKRDELAAMLSLASELRPRVVVEIGSDSGGTLLAWREAFPDADVAAISLPSGPHSTRRPLQSHGAHVIEADSHDATTRARLVEWLAGRMIDALFIDGDHNYEGARSDVEMYAPLVREGGLVALHDVVGRHFADVTMSSWASAEGVQRVWSELRGRKAEIVSEPATWGGIGIVRVDAAFLGLLRPALRVVVPFVDGKLHPATGAWAEANAAEVRYVGLDRGAYFRLMRELWSGGESFLIVEQDVVPPRGAVRQLAACAEPWCGFVYAYGGDDVLLRGDLGCTRFASSLIRAHPTLIDDTATEQPANPLDVQGGDDYRWLSIRLHAALRRAGVAWHPHDGRAAHHHEPEDLRRQNARELMELVGAMRTHRLNADFARKFGDDGAALRSESLHREAAELIVRMTERVSLDAMPEPVRVVIAEAVTNSSSDVTNDRG